MEKPRVMTMQTDPQRKAPLPLTSFRPPYAAIAKRAYEIYEETGRPNGRDVEIWLKAERELITER